MPDIQIYYKAEVLRMMSKKSKKQTNYSRAFFPSIHSNEGYEWRN